MIRRLGILLIGSLAGFLLMYWPMGVLVKEPPILVIGLAALVCVVPGGIVLAAAWQLRDKSPEVKIVGVLLTTVFRMGAAIAGGVLLYHGVPEVREYVSPFISWGIVFYLVTLFIETRLLYIDSSGQASQGPRS
jgi:hypothetical protein